MTLKRYDEDNDQGQDYLEDCQRCNREHARSELAWFEGRLICDSCDDEIQAERIELEELRIAEEA